MTQLPLFRRARRLRADLLAWPLVCAVAVLAVLAVLAAAVGRLR